MKRPLAVATLAGGTLFARRYLLAREAMAEVAPDLRSPVLPLLMTAPKLPLGRLFFRIKTSPGPGVAMTTRLIPAGAPVSALVFTPDGPDATRRPAVLWLHGGGRPPRPSDAPQYAAPARRADLSGLAPAWIGVGTLDLFHDESVAYAEALRASGVPCELVTVPGMYHGADGVARKAPAMLEFRRSSVEFLRGRL